MDNVVLKRWHIRLLLAVWCLTLFPTPLIASTETRPTANNDPVVQGAMLRYFEQMGGESVLGAPLTNERQEDGLVVQYFENARLEWWPRRNQVRLSPLGRLLYPHWRFFAREAAVERTSAQRHFPETGHTVRFAFLQFFEAHGGVKTFGLPISACCRLTMTGFMRFSISNERCFGTIRRKPALPVRFSLRRLDARSSPYAILHSRSRFSPARSS